MKPFDDLDDAFEWVRLRIAYHGVRGPVSVLIRPLHGRILPVTFVLTRFGWEPRYAKEWYREQVEFHNLPPVPAEKWRLLYD